ncbi:hypothetical protein NNC19_18350 [Clostridium sp. SHJSY1]|uniref:hypothetical protein n=1 Tax=Clostridium sp. SHJSY1 TaxID=2942483 RepID=UPI0028760776|nr:hypothetical protein [Clostridium sp. SHJSY1]MDS0527654.1 hypothetical protein [Clostridium sp. SHJSY1]
MKRFIDDNFEVEGMCHRRSVVWLGKVKRDNLNEYVRELLRNRSIITKFKHPADIVELDYLIKRLLIHGKKEFAIMIIYITCR